MPTVIDSLVLELGLDPEKLNKHSAEAIDKLRNLETEAKKRGKGVETAAKSSEEAFAILQKRLLGVAGLLTGGLGVEQFIQKMTKLQVATANVAQVFGLSSQSLQQWAAAGERVGVSGGSIIQGLKGLQDQRLGMALGDPAPLLRLQYGTANSKNPLTVSRNGHMLPPEQMAMEIARWLQKEGPQGAAALRKYGGISEDFIALLMKGPERLKKMLEESKKFTPTDDEIKRFQSLNDSFEKASQAATRFGTVLAAMVAPILSDQFLGAADVFMRIVSAIDHLQNGEYGKAGGDLLGSPEISQKKDKLAQLESKLRGLEQSGGGLLGLFGKPTAEINSLKEEIAKLREEIKKQEGLVHKESYIGGFGAGGANARLTNAAFSAGDFSGMNFRGSVGDGMGGAGGRGAGGRTSGQNYGDVGAAHTGKLAGSRIGVAKAAMMAQLRAEGVPEANINAAASALIGQALAESNLNPNLSHDGGTGYGIYGARLGRRARMFAWLEKNGYAKNSLEGQAKYMAHEAMSGAYGPSRRALMGATSDNLASVNRTLTDNFEAPKVRNYGPRYNGARGALGAKAADDMADVPLPHARPDIEHMLRSGGGGRGGGAVTHSTSIDNIHIHTQATDAHGIASEIRPAIMRFSRVASANYGPT